MNSRVDRISRSISIGRTELKSICETDLSRMRYGKTKIRVVAGAVICGKAEGQIGFKKILEEPNHKTLTSFIIKIYFANRKFQVLYVTGTSFSFV
jgi:hypothetical protein